MLSLISQLSWGRWLTGSLFALGIATATWLAFGRTAAVVSGETSDLAAANLANRVAVDVVSPSLGGIDRVCLQPGIIEPFEAADLYTKVSGFLLEQTVDIGDRVKARQALVRIWVPELEKQVKQDEADITKAKARVDQMAAAIASAEADLGSASALIALSQAEKKSKSSYRAYREKQRDRIKDLAESKSVDAKLAEEHEDQYQAAFSADLAAGEAINSARQKESAARARVKQAQADLRFAEADVATAVARMEKSQVLLEYAVIRSPYDGVVTKRNFHPGDFIRSADAGGDRMPVLAVERTDVMRVVIQVPERDVPFVDGGDPAIVEVDALPGVVYQSNGVDKVVVTRMAASEDPHTHMMRTEVHLKNANGKLRRGMFGRVRLNLEMGAPGALRIPSATLTGKADSGKGMVRVVRDGKAYLIPIRYGSDNGTEVEVLSGIQPTDRVILRANGPLEEGTAVTIVERKPSKGGH